MHNLQGQLHQWLHTRENEHLECKEAKEHFDFEALVKYCCALANEGGGVMLLGVSDKLPRKIVGTQAFKNLERTKAGLVERLRLRINTEEIITETQHSFSTRDWLILDLLSREKNVPDSLKPRLHDLIEIGIVERIGKRRVILSRKYYRFVGKKGEYTRKSGLDKGTNKALLEKHIYRSQKRGQSHE